MINTQHLVLPNPRVSTINRHPTRTTMTKRILATLVACAAACCPEAQPANTPAKPALMAEEETLKKVLAIAMDPNDNGLQLVDTFSAHSRYLVTNASTLSFP